ncbi:HAD-IA family hydrolase [Conexibacter stalactiti]|uniref:HAD-IA family hydrolase n=1 Tax=Conexibacter stalactiti TaxID=1940611 RepID=A0ABU4HKS3_9ACTN|nr:HAD-IA family hydrolase [Conexibacter stalactiti]MDW5593309.1 HAD-IA family hydrolase [Conexibacter stalactiti]MEC5033950.1 HAD-IA family hydrolase [Conexibacter stalactiti]
MADAPQAYLLDALGTLLELEPPVEPLRRALAERFGLRLTAAEAGAAMKAEIRFYRANHDIAHDRATLARLRRGAASALRDALPPAAAGLDLDALTEALLAALRFRPFPEVPEVLRRARAAGIGLVVVSNWDVSLHDALEQTGLASLLDGVVTSAEVGSAKPGGEIFARGLALAGVEAAAALHVGDDLEADVGGARAAGIDARLVLRDGAPAPAGVATVRSLRELPGIAAA